MSETDTALSEARTAAYSTLIAIQTSVDALLLLPRSSGTSPTSFSSSDETNVARIRLIESIDKLPVLDGTRRYFDAVAETADTVPSVLDASNQYGQLILEAVALLQQALVSRREYENLAERASAAWATLAEAIDLDKIQQQRVEAGILQNPIDDVNSEIANDKALKEGAIAQLSTLNTLENGVSDGRIEGDNISEHYYRLAAWSGHYGAVPGNRNLAWPEPGNPRYNGAFNPLTELVGRIAEDMARFNGRLRFYEYRQSVESLKAQEAVLESREKPLANKLEYFIKDKALRQEEINVTTLALLAKAEQVAKGAVNYARRLEEVGSSYQIDIADAADRLFAVQRGVSELLGLAKRELPSRHDLGDIVSVGIERWIEWARVAINQINRVEYLDSNFVARVRLAERSGVSIIDGRESGWTIVLDPSEFGDRDRVRVLGFSAEYDAENEREAISLEVSVPSKGVSYPSIAGSTPIDQSKAGVVRLGAVRHRDAPIPREVSISSALMNRTPFPFNIDDGVLNKENAIVVRMPVLSERALLRESDVREISLYLHVVARS